MTERFQVVITDLIDDDLAPERAVLAGLADVKALVARHEDALVGHIERADAIILYHELSLTRSTIDRLERCRVIVRGGVGYDNVDRQLARKRNIAVANIPDYGTEEVADSALALMLGMTRGIYRSNSRLRPATEDWSYHVGTPLVRLRGRVLGIVGLGRIGTAMAVRGKALGMDVLFYDPYKPDGYDKALGIRRAATLAELLGSSLVVSLHCPLSEETFHLIDAKAIALMPRGSYLVNTARGGVVDCLRTAGCTRLRPVGGGRNRCAGERAAGSGRPAAGGLAKSRTRGLPSPDPESPPGVVLRRRAAGTPTQDRGDLPRRTARTSPAKRGELRRTTTGCYRLLSVA